MRQVENICCKINTPSDFLRIWGKYMPEGSYGFSLFNKRISRYKDVFFGYDFDAINIILECIGKPYLHNSIILLLSQHEALIEKILKHMCDSNGNIKDDYCNLTYKELEEIVIKLGGCKFNLTPFLICKYKEEFLQWESTHIDKISMLKDERSVLMDVNDFLLNNYHEIKNIIKNDLFTDEHFLREVAQLIKKKRRIKEEKCKGLFEYGKAQENTDS